jgi:hypothetical protein
VILSALVFRSNNSQHRPRDVAVVLREGRQGLLDRREVRLDSILDQPTGIGLEQGVEVRPRLQRLLFLGGEGLEYGIQKLQRRGQCPKLQLAGQPPL